jgi:predicted DNA-binding transcriptional regulator AlpA
MNVMMPPPLVSTREAARAVGINPFFLYRRVHQIPAVYRAGRVLRWDVEALKEWMREQARTV